MGDNFLKQQIRNFEKSTDLAVDTLERAKLIRRSEVSKTSYKAKPLDGESFGEKEALYAVVAKDGLGIVLSRGHRHVGDITGQGAEVLREEMGGLGSILKVRVVSVSEVSRWATVEVIQEGNP
jgi:hypothetical protein